jgi:hypothetical protein|tara:strand:+ start:2788 stop:2916 length:129 start_codon:yes stop_codon:yes gene_type:complete
MVHSRDKPHPEPANPDLVQMEEARFVFGKLIEEWKKTGTGRA